VIRSRFAKLDMHMQEVIKGASLAFMMKVIGAGLAFIFNVVIARLLGAEGAGLYFLALSITAIGSVVGRVGLDNTLLRFIAIHATNEEWGKVKGVYYLGMRMAILVSGVIALLGFFGANWLAEVVFNNHQLAEPLRWMSLSILPFAILNLQAESLKGLKRIPAAMFVQGIGLPLFGLLLIWPLAKENHVQGVAWVYLIAASIVALFGKFAWQRALAFTNAKTAQYLFADIWTSCKPLLVVNFMNRAVLPWAPVFLLGIWASIEDVGIFGAASRISAMVSFMLLAVNNVLAPKFAELYSRGEMKALEQTARKSALFITLLASPIFLLLFFGGEWVMSMFGPKFSEGGLVLTILVSGQFVNTLTGSVRFILISTGNEMIVRNIIVVSTVIQVLICVCLIPLLGMLGAAIATALALAGMNLAAAYMVWKRLGIKTIPLPKWLI